MLQCSKPVQRYVQLLSDREIRSLFLASAAARFPIGIVGLALLLLAQQASGSFAVGGLASGCYMAGLAVAAPFLGRSIDRLGARPTLLACAFAYPIALGCAAFCFAIGAPSVVGLLLSACAGACFPPVSASMRSFFSERLRDDAELATAYSLESVLIEVTFIAGPLLVALFVSAGSALSAVLFSAACALSGTVAYASQRALANRRANANRAAGGLGPLDNPAFARLLAVAVLYASAFGLVEIGVVAYAVESGAPALAGLLLGAMSAGSVAGGLAYGARTWSLPPVRQFPRILALMALGIALLGFALPLWLWALCCVVAGIAMAPALIVQSMLVAKTSELQHAAEAFTWSATALLAGIGGGLALGGKLLESAPWPAVFAAAAAASLVAAALALRQPGPAA